MSSNNLAESSVTPTKVAGRLRRDFVLNPITALAFLTSSLDGRRYLLAGEDNHVKIFDVGTSRLCATLPVFRAQSIHGIAVAQEDSAQQHVLIWGGHSLAILPRLAFEAQLSQDKPAQDLPYQVFEAKAPDWIFDASLSPYDSSSFVLLTAHNEIVQGHLNVTKGMIEFGKLASPSRPILYAGNLSWESEDCVLVAAGTVFGEILIWKFTAKPREENARCELLFVFEGHEGSIFGVHISAEIRLDDGESLRLLASCSDDRTIRVWNITDSPQNSRQRHESSASSARETGFGGNVTLSQEEASSRCLAVVMGHSSRIWQVQFPPTELSNGPDKLDLWSFGEDSTTQKWSLPLASLVSPASSTVLHASGIPKPTTSPLQLYHHDTFSTHNGKNIWSHAMSITHEGDLLITTGGSDGKISLIQPSSDPSSRYSTLDTAGMPRVVPRSQPLQLSDPDKMGNHELDPEVAVTQAQGAGSTGTGVNEAPLKKVKKKVKSKDSNETLHRFKFISEDHLLAATSSGRILVGAVESPLSTWTEVAPSLSSSASLFSQCIIESSVADGLAFIGTGTGQIFLYRNSQPSKLDTLTNVHGKVVDMFHLVQHAISDSAPVSSEDFTESSSITQTHLLVTILGSMRALLLSLDCSVDATVTKEDEVTLPDGFIVTSAALCGKSLVLGSRNGRISILQPQAQGVYAAVASRDGTIKDAVTSITLLSDKECISSVDFLTTSRDGKYRIFKFLDSTDTKEVALLHETSPPLGPMIEGAWFSTNHDGSKSLMLCGFRSKNFVVWNETLREEVAAVDCGGGHRTFTYIPLAHHPNGVKFVYTKASQIHGFSQPQPQHRTLKPGGHGREIKAVSFSGKYLATAAEDTTIRIWDYDSYRDAPSSELRCSAVMEKHTTGVQTLKWSQNSHLFSSGGNEEFFVWHISELMSTYDGIAVMCESVFPDRSEAGDLRIMDFDVHLLETPSDTYPVFLISMALSNSVLQTYRYSEPNGFRLLARGSYTGACLAQLRHLQVDTDIVRTLTGATDGHIAVWEASVSTAQTQEDPYKSLVVTKIHQSTIKSLDIRHLDIDTQNSYLIVTGGDDNALGVMHLRNEKGTDAFVAQSKAIIRSAHAAAITGTVLLSCNDDGTEAVVVSNSNDQRVKTWGLTNWQSSDMEIALLDDQYSSVADSGDLEVLDGSRVIVGGVGMEIWDIEC